MNDKYDIVPVRGHYEVRRNGNFICSADTVPEAAREVDLDKYKNTNMGIRENADAHKN